MAIPSNVPNWNQVNADFGNSNNALRNAQTSISQVGTIFSDLRRSILDEEQRAIDSAFREKQLSENVRQFDATNTLNRDKLGEDVRQFNLSDENADLDRAERIRNADMNNRIAQASNSIQNTRLGLEQQRYQDYNNFRNAYKNTAIAVYGPRDALDQQITQGRNELETLKASGQITPEQITEREATLTRLDAQRKELSDTDLQARFQREMAMQGFGGDRVITTPSDMLAANEQSRVVKGIEFSKSQKQAYDQSLVKSDEMLKTLNLGQEDTIALQNAMVKILETNPNLKPDVAMSILTGYYPLTGEIFSGKNKFDVPVLDTDYIVNFDPNDSTNPIAIRIAQASGTAKNLINSNNNNESTSDDTELSNVNLTTLSPEALDYREQQILNTKPSVDTVTKNSDDYKTMYDKLYQATYGDMPKNKVSANSLKTLEERALQETKTLRENARTQSVRSIENERNRRNQERLMQARFGNVF